MQNPLYTDFARPATLYGQPQVYPELVALVGAKVPDLRGLFLRGNGGNSAALGVQQGDAIRNITGRISIGNQYANAGVKWGEGALNVGRSFGGNDFKESGPNSSPDEIILDASLVVPTAEENRPVNKAVRYLIRALP